MVELLQKSIQVFGKICKKWQWLQYQLLSGNTIFVSDMPIVAQYQKHNVTKDMVRITNLFIW